MAKLKNINGHFVESDFENALITFLEQEDWRYLYGDNIPRMSALKQAFETTIYFFVLWLPMVIFICGKILFCKKDMKWGKTAHGLVKEEKQRIVDEINKKLQKLQSKLQEVLK